jgi:hypothetical protein
MEIEDDRCDEPENKPFKAEHAKILIPNKRKAACHENCSEARQHVNNSDEGQQM